MFDLPVSSLQVLSDGRICHEQFRPKLRQQHAADTSLDNRIFREPLFFGTAVELKHSHQLHNLHVFT